ncbi:MULTISPECIES: DUF6199 family natural product biosynthesis protein [Paenibacillus]|uniref:DUF6199 domain-containing protein n=1 Tax=Paenibacillus illinoisensis TaxID=59845 RepID=A0A2W0C483_9BACL|nr:DUF6199 family natural product biosynthesis protein [Paenibacillus xylanilyticus]PAD30723.1 hypothetical protein CHH60_12220 [Paenibacillus sp. 7523-1]PAF30685.1 hypothetical protein CHI14_18335 [Paenibacillus sp. 7516]PYY27383.1 Uncharacterized protein PIL02S_03941 [Paenibacillus illinoisensis]
MRTLFFIFMTLCIINLCFPKFGWYLRYGWISRGESEPSKPYMTFTRLTSLVMLIIAFTLASA